MAKKLAFLVMCPVKSYQHEFTSSSALLRPDDEGMCPDLLEVQALDGLDQPGLRVDGKLILELKKWFYATR